MASTLPVVMRLVALLVALALAAAACGGSEPSSGAGTSPSGVGGGSVAPPTPADGSGGTPATAQPTVAPPTATEAPVATQEPETSDDPVATDDPGDPPAAGTADVCTGNDANREFFATLAAQVDWPVLCAVLPSRWFVSTGSYRLANGGRLEISYKGPGGATLALSEGAFCSEADGCVPPGSGAGEAALGPLDGTLVALDDGGWAVVVDRGARPSWLLVAHGLDREATLALGVAMAEVAGS